MFQYLSGTDDEYCIIDHDKLLIQSVSEDELWKMLVLDGIALRCPEWLMERFVSRKRQMAASECNWANGENIFLKAKRFAVADDNRFSWLAGNRQFDGVVDKSDKYAVILCFRIGAQVPIMKEDFEELLSGDVKRVVPMLKSIGSPVEDKDFDIAYYSALHSGNEEAIKLAVRNLVSVGQWPLVVEADGG